MASLTAPSFATVADCTVNTDMLGDDGPSLPLPLAAVTGLRVAHVAVEMAVAREIGIKHRPLP